MKGNELKKAVDTIILSETAKERILEDAMNSKKERRIMTKKKIGIVAVAAAMVIGAVAYASSGLITWSSHSSNIPEYPTFPTKAEIAEDLGFAPKLVEIFNNGFAYQSAGVTKNAIEFEGKTEKFKSFGAEYHYADETVFLEAFESKYEPTLEGEKIVTVDGIDLYFSQATHKSVPPEYVPTEEDKAAEARGELMLGYGSNEIEMREFKFLTWVDDDIKYSMSIFDGTLDADGMVAMAGEMIAQK